MHKLKEIEAQLLESPDKQISLTDPDARSMATSGRGTGALGYNVQTAVDDKHYLIIAHEVTNVGNDRAQLSNMANQARAEIGAKSPTVVADRGYYKGLEILACERAGITTFVPNLAAKRKVDSVSRILSILLRRTTIDALRDNY